MSSTRYARALHAFKAENERPTLIVVHSHMGYGSPVEEHPKGARHAVRRGGVSSTKRFLGMPPDKDFFVPVGVYEHFAAGIGARGRQARSDWEARFKAYRIRHPELADELLRIQRRDRPDGWSRRCRHRAERPRASPAVNPAGRSFNALAQVVPWVLGGSAKLITVDEDQPHVCRRRQMSRPMTASGRNLHLGVRESTPPPRSRTGWH